jgi:hypothetical protein
MGASKRSRENKTRKKGITEPRDMGPAPEIRKKSRSKSSR